MRKCLLLFIALAGLSMAACEETLEKTYECPVDYPYFNVYDTRCYKTPEDAQEINKYIQQERENAKKNAE